MTALSPEFLLTAFIVCITPGIGVVYTLSVTLGGGFRAGFWATIGCTIATVLHMVVAMAGLAAVLHTSAVLFQTIKYAGVAYLLWMAWAVLQSTGSLAVEASDGGSPRRLVARGILLNILNPKLPLFFVAFLPQFLPAHAAGLGPLLELGTGFTVMTFLTFLLYAVVAASGRKAILSSPSVLTWMKRAFAASFAALGARLALERAP
ncbi:LysE family translocator [Pseudogemmobacter blasticus]|uniref:LysE family translocator n=1 Tax=Fuscovulum blasticum DSM 2131 TaxID=1188250 RepID=A0A2T4JC48_FUSBL|nr:LysE family translocator [Fuscovulum blasticum]PTE15397.1 LysE family translocator [Fuscovulum blasticum DSM 2131]